MKLSREMQIPNLPFWYSNIADDSRGTSLGAEITDSDFTPFKRPHSNSFTAFNFRVRPSDYFYRSPSNRGYSFFTAKKTSTNFNKAKWDNFIEIKTKLSETVFMKKLLFIRKVTLESARRHIPTGLRRFYIPDLTA